MVKIPNQVQAAELAKSGIKDVVIVNLQPTPVRVRDKVYIVNHNFTIIQTLDV